MPNCGKFPQFFNRICGTIFSLLLQLRACDIVWCLHVCSRLCLRFHARFESECVCVHDCVLQKLPKIWFDRSWQRWTEASFFCYDVVSDKKWWNLEKSRFLIFLPFLIFFERFRFSYRILRINLIQFTISLYENTFLF